jgi:hypothetical protein
MRVPMATAPAVVPLIKQMTTIEVTVTIRMVLTKIIPATAVAPVGQITLPPTEEEEEETITEVEEITPVEVKAKANSLKTSENNI